MSFIGVRVVRGPDWHHGDEDGGEGGVGTIIGPSKSEMKRPGAKRIAVAWDNGFKGRYRGGPQGCHDLRIIDNGATGVKHQVSCGGCMATEIRGMRWECVACSLNLCSPCFLKKIPHNIEHNQFKRYDNSKITNPPIIVNCWSPDGGPDTRVELKGSIHKSRAK